MRDKQFYHNECMPNTTKERVVQFHRAKYSWWSNPIFIIILTLIMSGMDGLVLYSVFDKAMMQSWYMGLVMAFGVSVVLNLIPIFVGRFVHRAIYKTHRHSGILAALAVSAFLILYGTTVYLRFAYQDMYGDAGTTSLVNALTSGSEDDIVDDKKTARSKAVVILLAIEPLATSICGFVLSFLSDDELEREIETLEVQIADLEYEIAWKKAGIESMKESETRVNLELMLEDEILQNEENCVWSEADVLKAISRNYLGMYLEDPASISKLSFQMGLKESQGKTKMYEYLVANDSLFVVNND